jgi:hypothetical protein
MLRPKEGHELCAFVLVNGIGEMLTGGEKSGIVGHESDPFALDEFEMFFEEQVGTRFDLRSSNARGKSQRQEEENFWSHEEWSFEGVGKNKADPGTASDRPEH